jgi:enoyl-CoA hydratase
MALVTASDHGVVRVLTADRPPRNAVDLALITALGEAIEAAATDESVQALVLTGAGAAFSAGVDVKVVPTYGRAARAEMIRGIDGAILALFGMPKPTVAAVNGHALGGGLVIALACDVRVAAAGTYSLGLLEVTAGIPFPAGPLIVVQSQLDPQTASTLALTGRTVGPTDELATRFIDAVVPADVLLATAVERAQTLAGLRGYAAVKRQLRAAALARLEAIVLEDSDPLLDDWF